MIRGCVSGDSAVAVCPAPMLHTSRRASICSYFKSRTSSMAPSLEEPAGVENQRRDPVAHDRGPAEHGEHALRRIEALHDDLLLAEHAVHDDAAAAVPPLEHDDGGSRPPGGRHPDPAAPQP